MTVPTRVRRSWVPPIIVVVSALLVFAVLNPWLIFTANTPAGGDMGAHVYGPAYMRDFLLPRGWIQGWSNDWFAGFPLYYFYFPLPSLVIVFLDLFLPYGVAFKLVTVAGLLGLPPAVYFLARALRFPMAVAGVAAAAAAAFAFMESFSIYGANIASTLAGEFSFSWSFSLGFVYLGLLIRTIRGEPHLVPWAAAVFALAALSHILVVIVLVVASLFVLVWKGASRVAIPIWVWAAALTAFWSLPFVIRIGFSTDMAWTPLTRWEEVFPVEIWLLLPPALAGVVWAARRTAYVLPVLVTTLVPVIYYPLPSLLASLAPGIFGEGRFKLWNGRLLPYWYFGVGFFAAVAVGAFVLWVSRRLPELISPWWGRAFLVLVGLVGVGLVLDASDVPRWATAVVGLVVLAGLGISFLWRDPVSARGTLVGVAGSILALGGLAGVTFVDGWARWNYSGYEGKETWPQYQALMQTVSGLDDGRVMWEFNPELDRFGTTMSLMLIPYWTGHSHPSMEGLFFESSLTVPFHFLNQAEMSFRPSAPVPGLRYRTFDFERGVEHLELYGVEYYVAYTQEAKDKADTDPRLEFVTDSDPFRIYRLLDSAVVEPLSHEVTVYERESGGMSFGDFALEWYDDVENLDRIVAAEGPEEWRRVSELTELAGASPVGEVGEVSDVEIGENRVSFRTTAVGVPHLVKVSYFPNWRAEGAEGPYRATPSLMVVVPTEEEVVLEFGRTWVEYAGVVSTLAGLGAFLWWRRGRHENLREGL